MRKRIFIANLILFMVFSPYIFAINGKRDRCENLLSSLKREFKNFIIYKKYRTYKNFKHIVYLEKQIESSGKCEENSSNFFKLLYLKANIFKSGGEIFRKDRYLIYSMKIFAEIYEEGVQRNRKKEIENAILNIAKIYDTHFHFKDRALYWYEKYLDIFYRGRKRKWVKKRARDLSNYLRKISDKEIFSMNRKEFSLITRVDFWSSGSSTRVVVELDGPVYYTKNVLKGPYRVFIDFYNAYANPFFIKRAIVVNGQCLRRVRVGQFKKNIARVVLDFDREIKVTTFHLDNPFKLVVDVNLEGKRLVKNKVPGTLKKVPGTIKKNKKNRRIVENNGKRKVKPVKNGKKGEKTKSKVSKGEIVEVIPPEKINRNTLTRVLGLKVRTVVIDPGHGGKDPGTIGYKGIKEKDVALRIAKKLKTLLEKKLGIKVILTRDRDVFIPLEERPLVATKNNADLFISIHANSSKNDRAAGIETFYLGFTKNRRSLSIAAYENALYQKNIGQLENVIKKITLNEKLKESRKFALDVNASLWRTVKRLDPYAKNRGVKKAPFVVLIGTRVPSVLVEIGFLSNKREANIISSRKNQNKIAKALYEGIYKYLKEVGRVEKRASVN